MSTMSRSRELSVLPWPARYSAVRFPSIESATLQAVVEVSIVRSFMPFPYGFNATFERSLYWLVIISNLTLIVTP
jgi:hypothetical protein